MKPVVWRGLLGGLVILEIVLFSMAVDTASTYTALGSLLQSVAALLGLEITYRYLRRRNVILRGWISNLIILMTLSDAAGDYLLFYDKFVHYDAYLHFTIPAVVTICLMGIVWSVRPTFLHWPSWPLLVATIVITAGVFYEIEEYLEDVLFGSHRLGDGFDTANDLSMNVLGAFLPALIMYFYLRRNYVQRDSVVSRKQKPQ